jgi:hypothetical protein
MVENSNEHLGSSDGSSGMNTAAWLRIMAALMADDGKPHAVMMEAADRIERMRDALERIRSLAFWHCDLAIVRECSKALE